MKKKIGMKPKKKALHASIQNTILSLLLNMLTEVKDLMESGKLFHNLGQLLEVE